MSLLNFANTYEEVSDRLLLPESGSGEYVKLFFTKDGHIISHGVDYTPLFSVGKKGLVPGSNGNPSEFLRGTGNWAKITTTDLPIATSISEAILLDKTTTTILNTQLIIEYVNDSFAANDAMRYKGTIAYEDGNYYTHTTEGVKNEGFPTKCLVGDTYRIIVSSDTLVYAGQKGEAGDLMTCIKDGTGDSLNQAEYWTVILTNINGQVRHSVNGTPIYTYSNSSNVFNIYAPTSGGTLGLVLISNGNSAPIWVSLSSISSLYKTILGQNANSIENTSIPTNNPYINLIKIQDLDSIVISSILITGNNKTSVIGSNNNITISSSWRDITIGGISINDKSLNFIPTGDIYIKAGANGDNIQDISFGLSWYNISNGSYEYDLAHE